MRLIPFLFSSTSAAVCLILSVWLFVLNAGNRDLQTQLQHLQQQAQSQQQVLQEEQKKLETQQEQINAGTTISQQIGPALLRDLAVASTTNEKMKALLSKHGYNVTPNDGGPEDAASPQP